MTADPFTPAQLAALKATAEQAEPGEWYVYQPQKHCYIKSCANDYYITDRVLIYEFANAAHIAAFCPPVVLRLLAELEAARASNVELQDALESMVNQHCTYGDAISDGALSANREAIGVLVRLRRLKALPGRQQRYEWIAP